MKKTFCIILACVMLLSCLPLVSLAAGESFIDTKNKRFALKDAPEITKISVETRNNGVYAEATFLNSTELAAMSRYFRACEETNDLCEKLFGAADDWGNSIRVYLQLAYSIDGKKWVNEQELTEDGTPAYELDADGDGYNEYVYLPTYEKFGETWYSPDLCETERLFSTGSYSVLTGSYCSSADGMSVQDALTKRSAALLCGAGEFTGTKFDAEDSEHGYTVDFNKHTLYVKARYCTVTEYGMNDETVRKLAYSDWSDAKSYNNKTSSDEAQGIIPTAAELNTKLAPSISVIRKTKEKNGDGVTEFSYRVAVTLPEKLRQAMAKIYSIDSETLKAVCGEYYKPKYTFEIKTGSGDWYILDTIGFMETEYTFENSYRVNELLEEIGYKPEDSIFIRTRILGESSRSEQDGKLVPAEQVNISTGVSNELEVSFNGIYSVRYHYDGSFPYDSTQLSTFDDDTEKTVDLTAADYVPEYEHHTFNGWYDNPDFTGEAVTSFTTAGKYSRDYYAKFTEDAHYNVTYDYDSVTSWVDNTNPEKVYIGETVTLTDAETAGVNFLGWYNAGEKVTALKYDDMTGDITLTAKWEMPSMKITYAGAGEDYTNNAKNPAEYQMAPDGSSEVLLYAPEKAGYIFDGWFLDSEHTNALYFNEEKTCWVLRESTEVTLYAKWILGRWKINYIYGTEDYVYNDNPEEYTYGDAVKLKAPERAGYIFDGWFTDADFKTAAADITETDTGDRTLYAKWTPITYKINYDLRDEKAGKYLDNPNPAERTFEETKLMPLTPTAKLYKFLGWYDNVNFDGEPVTVITGTQDVTVYAKLYRYSWGDADEDGQISASDARLVLRQAVGLEDLDADVLAWCDVDAPSAECKIEAGDARAILRMSVALESAESLALPELPAAFA